MKNTYFFKNIVILTMFFALSFLFHSCSKKEICIEARDDNFHDEHFSCDPEATVAKFCGDWIIIDFVHLKNQYPISISPAAEPYTINVKSNYGFGSEIFENEFNVNQKNARCLDEIYFLFLGIKIRNLRLDVQGDALELRYWMTKLDNQHVGEYVERGYIK